MVKKLLPILMLAVLTGCSGDGLTNASDEDQKEYILTQLNDYQGLIEIYRKKLSANDNDEDRFHLSQLYYNVGDFGSSSIYLQPLVEKNKDEKYLLLQVKNNLELGQEDKANTLLNSLLAKNSERGELWNLQGVLFAQQGKYSEAISSFEKARGLFYNEEIVINNLAMMAILQQDYSKARNYLLPLYSRKQYKPQTVYNLVYTLVKSNDYESARKIIVDEKLVASEPDRLINSLSMLSPREQFNMPQQDVVGGQSENSTKQFATVQQKEAVLASTVASKNIQNNKNNDSVQNNTLTEDKIVSVNNTQHQINENKVSEHVASTSSEVCSTGNNTDYNIEEFKGNIANAKNIAKLTSATIENGDKLALYSSYPLNYIVMPQQYSNQIDIELFNVQPVKSIYQSQLSIIKAHPSLQKIEFINKGNNVTLLRIVTKPCILTKNINRSSVKGKLKEKIIIDLSYK